MKHIRTAIFLKTSFILTAVNSIFFSGCTKDHFFDFTKSAGKTVTVYRNCTDFNHMEIMDDVDVIIHTDTVPFIRVTAGQNIVDGITTEIRDGVLTVRNENRSNWVRSFKNSYCVEIGTDSLCRISFHGSGTIRTADTLQVTDFTFDSRNASGSILLVLDCTTSHLNVHTGRCDLTVSGHSDVTYYYLNDTGIINGSGLRSAYTYARNSGTGVLHLYAENELGVEILHTGDIRYGGNPYRIDSEITGSGRLIKE
ncbi:MAG: hypothetical protein RL213_451 [Bacteroidota bacterium]